MKNTEAMRKFAAEAAARDIQRIQMAITEDGVTREYEFETLFFVGIVHGSTSADTTECACRLKGGAQGRLDTQRTAHLFDGIRSMVKELRRYAPAKRKKA